MQQSIETVTVSTFGYNMSAKTTQAQRRYSKSIFEEYWTAKRLGWDPWLEPETAVMEFHSAYVTDLAQTEFGHTCTVIAKSTLEPMALTLKIHE